MLQQGGVERGQDVVVGQVEGLGEPGGERARAQSLAGGQPEPEVGQPRQPGQQVGQPHVHRHLPRPRG
ncbi:MAG TPA: hypothetical protein VFX88_13395 [Actinomycetota bacterium]|nr:hypothetical protein [Actinomycetota bacterium]